MTPFRRDPFEGPRRRAPGRRLPAWAALAAVLVAAACSAPNANRAPAAGWHLSWRAETAFPATSEVETTCRFLARLSGSGSRVRAEFADLDGKDGYSVVAASIARPASPGSLSVLAGSSRPLAFGAAASPSTPVPAGGTVLSAPVAWAVSPGSEVLVTVTASAGDAFDKAAVSEPGGCATQSVDDPAAAGADAFAGQPNVRYLRSLLVDGPAQRSVVALGDSLTEIPTSPTFAPVRWTDALLADGTSVANAGVIGNALTHLGVYGTAPGRTRVTALLAEPGVTDLVVLMGTNDLGSASSATEVLDGLSTVLADAKALGVKTWVGTIPPRRDGGWTPLAEAQRQAVNSSLRGSWLLARGGGLLDTDLTLRNPKQVTALLPAYDCGDHLHPNARGAAAVGALARTTLGLTR